MENKEYSYIGWVRVLALIIPYLVVVTIFQLIGYWVSGVDLNNLELAKSTGQQAVVSFFGLLGTL